MNKGVFLRVDGSGGILLNPAFILNKALEDGQSLRAHMMLDPFCVGSGNLRGNTHRFQKIDHDAVPGFGFDRKILSGLSEKDRAVRLATDEIRFLKALQSPDHGDVGNSHNLCQINGTRFADFLDEIRDGFHVILCPFLRMLMPNLPLMRGRLKRRSWMLASAFGRRFFSGRNRRSTHGMFNFAGFPCERKAY